MKCTARDKHGKAFVSALSIEDAIEILAQFEEAAEAVGLEGPNQVRTILQHTLSEVGEGVWEVRKRKAPPLVKTSARKAGKTCGECVKYRLTSARCGICLTHKKHSRENGCLVELNENRAVTAKTVCCSSYIPRIDKAEFELPEYSWRGKFCRDLREWNNISERQVAYECGISIVLLRQWECGAKIMSDGQMRWLAKRICKICGWPWTLVEKLVLEEIGKC